MTNTECNRRKCVSTLRITSEVCNVIKYVSEFTFFHLYKCKLTLLLQFANYNLFIIKQSFSLEEFSTQNRHTEL